MWFLHLGSHSHLNTKILKVLYLYSIHFLVCRSRNTDCSNKLDAEVQLRYYKQQYSQCTHIVGNLVLCNLRRYGILLFVTYKWTVANGSDPDLSFLESVQEVSGYVYIGNNDVKQISLPSLRIIRGRIPYKVEELGDGALVVSRNAVNQSHGLEVLDLRSLTGEYLAYYYLMWPMLNLSFLWTRFI